MSFRSKILARLTALEEDLRLLTQAYAKERTTIAAYRELNERLTKQNEQLMDRLMAIDFTKFKTFVVPEHAPEPPPKWNPEEDEDMAGEAFDPAEVRNSNEGSRNA